MANHVISKEDLRKTLAKHIATADPSQGILHAFLRTEKPSAELILATDKVIINYLIDHGTPVFSKGERFFLPISKKFGQKNVGDPLIYTRGEHAGEPMKDDRLQWGIRFTNAGDGGIEQAVRGDGESVIIIGGGIDKRTGEKRLLTPEKIARLQRKLNTLTRETGDPEQLTLTNVKALLRFAAHDLGLDDIWAGKLTDVEKTVPVDGREFPPRSKELRHYTGHFAHKSTPGRGLAAIYVEGGAKFHGDVAGGTQHYTFAPGFFVTIGITKDRQTGEDKSQYRGVAIGPFSDYVTLEKAPYHPGMLFTIHGQTKSVTPPSLPHPDLFAAPYTGRDVVKDMFSPSITLDGITSAQTPEATPRTPTTMPPNKAEPTSIEQKGGTPSEPSPPPPSRRPLTGSKPFRGRPR